MSAQKSRRACLCGSTTCNHKRRRPSTSHVYGSAHQERRRRMLASTPETCARCGRGPIPGDPWEAGHVVDAVVGGGPDVQREHRSCNRRAGAQRLKALRKEAADRRAAQRIADTARLLRGRTG